jgi:hypothetical protein
VEVELQPFLTSAVNGDNQHRALTGLPPIPCVHQAAWFLYPVWTQWRTKPHILLRPAHGTVTILTELYPVVQYLCHGKLNKFHVSLVAVIKPKAKEKISSCRYVFILNLKRNFVFPKSCIFLQRFITTQK